MAWRGCIRNARRPVSRVLSAPPSVSLGRAGRPFLWDAPRGAPHATNPDGEAGMPPHPCRCRRPYSVLLPVGFTLPPLLPGARCALAAPFRPCPRGISRPLRGRFVFCGTVPEVTLAGGWPAPFSRGARTFLCRRVPTAAVRPSGCAEMRGRCRSVKALSLVAIPAPNGLWLYDCPSRAWSLRRFDGSIRVTAWPSRPAQP